MERIRGYDFVEGGVSLEAGFGASKAHTVSKHSLPDFVGRYEFSATAPVPWMPSSHYAPIMMLMDSDPLKP